MKSTHIIIQTIQLLTIPHLFPVNFLHSFPKHEPTLDQNILFPRLRTLRWMDLETVIQSEVSQKEKKKYHILMDICGI